MADPIIIYTDGAASGNPGPGGFGVVLKVGVYRKELMAGFRKTTNNQQPVRRRCGKNSANPAEPLERKPVAGGRLFGFPVCGRCC